jgi:hypothetical protein
MGHIVIILLLHHEVPLLLSLERGLPNRFPSLWTIILDKLHINLFERPVSANLDASAFPIKRPE